MRQATSQLVCFHGPPASLEALVPAAAVRSGAAQLELPELDLAGPASCSEAGHGLWWVHARLPRQTPAGTHVGQLSFADAEPLAVEVVVYLDYEVALSPMQLSVQVAPGRQTQHRFVIINQGNASVVLARDLAIGLLREGSLEAATSFACRAKVTGGIERVEIAADVLSERHALVIARIEGGPIIVAPQTHRRFEATLRWPNSLVPDHVYAGTWQLAHQNLSVRVSVLAPGVVGT
jgi:hypothetical protein